MVFLAGRRPAELRPSPRPCVCGRRDCLLTSRHPHHGARRAWPGSGRAAGLTYSADRAMRHFRGLRQPFPITGSNPVPAAAGCRRQCRPGRPCVASGRDTSWRVAPGRSPARTAAGRSGDRQLFIAGNICRCNPDIRSRLLAFTIRDAYAAPGANVTHIGPEQPGNARPCGNRGQPGELMILILSAEPGTGDFRRPFSRV